MKERLQRDINDLLRRAITTYGAESQWRMVQEECGELIAAINHAMRGRPDAQERLMEEVADVFILVEQARLMLGKEELFALVVQRKLARLATRICTKGG